MILLLMTNLLEEEKKESIEVEKERKNYQPTTVIILHLQASTKVGNGPSATSVIQLTFSCLLASHGKQEISM